jgi:hypothetical protein
MMDNDDIIRAFGQEPKKKVEVITPRVRPFKSRYNEINNTEEEVVYRFKKSYGTPTNQNINMPDSSDMEESVLRKWRSNNSGVSPNQPNFSTNTSGSFEDKVIGDWKSGMGNQSFGNQPNQPDINNIKIGASDLNSVGSKLQDIPPLLIIGIIAMIAPWFIQRFWWLQTVGFLLIILAIFQKVIPAEKQKEMAQKFKAMFKKKEPPKQEGFRL